ncbi:MAG: biotin--[acetyl-CoA-carboxylase] ligase [Sphaerochaetaceae bacterium]|nr:biotin--[acetyl-CoA-carboxylase] ligase [Sphaerochaetaceae bacterium]
MTSKDKVLTLLEQHKGSFISGEVIAQQLDITRAAVWRSIQDLRSSGHVIEASTKVGYKLQEESDVLSVQGITAALASKDKVNLVYHETIDSTNKEAKRLALEGAPHATVVVAGCQTEGRGRNGKIFYSPQASGLYLSMLMRPNMGTSMALRITAAAAVAVCRAIEDVSEKQAGIKWVNDIYCNNKKVCGILTEGISGFESGNIESVIVGIGINHQLPEQGFPPELKHIAGALFEGAVLPQATRNRLAAAVIKHLLWVVDNLDSPTIMAEYQQRSVVIGKKITVLQGRENYNATAVAIASDGALIVRLEDGKEQQLRSGEISLRPASGQSW